MANWKLLHQGLIGIFFIACSFSALAATPDTISFTPHSRYTVCFTPGNNCTQMIVQALNQAKEKVYVQAYSFTSQPIVDALVRTKQRGLQVHILLDKSNVHGRYSVIKTLDHYHIPYLIDEKPAIAHNKIMIIDDARVITGSFNFTNSAQNRNAENAIIIDDKNLARYYINNFKSRQQLSIPIDRLHLRQSSKSKRQSFFN